MQKVTSYCWEVKEAAKLKYVYYVCTKYDNISLRQSRTAQLRWRKFLYTDVNRQSAPRRSGRTDIEQLQKNYTVPVQESDEMKNHQYCYRLQYIMTYANRYNQSLYAVLLFAYNLLTFRGIYSASVNFHCTTRKTVLFEVQKTC